jgi:hypothetical protein
VVYVCVLFTAGVMPAVTVADSVGSLAGGATPTVILVLLSTLMLDTGTVLPSAAVMLTGVTGQASVAFSLVIKPVPFMTTLS